MRWNVARTFRGQTVCYLETQRRKNYSWLFARLFELNIEEWLGSYQVEIEMEHVEQQEVVGQVWTVVFGWWIGNLLVQGGR